jgi:ribosomal 50S subunit-associated protein YjgA (DUF615 family)
MDDTTGLGAAMEASAIGRTAREALRDSEAISVRLAALEDQGAEMRQRIRKLEAWPGRVLGEAHIGELTTATLQAGLDRLAKEGAQMKVEWPTPMPDVTGDVEALRQRQQLDKQIRADIMAVCGVPLEKAGLANELMDAAGKASDPQAEINRKRSTQLHRHGVIATIDEEVEDIRDSRIHALRAALEAISDRGYSVSSTMADTALAVDARMAEQQQLEHDELVCSGHAEPDQKVEPHMVFRDPVPQGWLFVGHDGRTSPGSFEPVKTNCTIRYPKGVFTPEQAQQLMLAGVVSIGVGDSAHSRSGTVEVEIPGVVLRVNRPQVHLGDDKAAEAAQRELVGVILRRIAEHIGAIPEGSEPRVPRRG